MVHKVDKENKSTIEEMYDILHQPEEDVVVAACRECTLILGELTKYCPECGAVTELGRATKALEKLGDEPPEDTDKAFERGPGWSQGWDSQPGVTPPGNVTSVWQQGNNTITATSSNDPLNQWVKDEDQKIIWEDYINGRKLSA